MKTTWIFDFDGTLVDSAQAIRRCFHIVTKELAPHRQVWCDEVRIGPPLYQTATLILDSEDDVLIQTFIQRFKEIYDGGEVLNTPIYAGATETLKSLYANGHQLTIATNKRGAPTRLLIDHLGWTSYFKHVACIDDLPDTGLGKFQLVTNLLQTLNTRASNCMFVGDTVGDGKVAHQHEMPFIYASYGYGQDDDWSNTPITKTITEPFQLLNVHE